MSRLTPKAGRDEVDSVGILADGRAVARVHVRAAPDKGDANRALIELLARTFRVPKSGIGIVAGRSSRLKQVRISGYPPELTGVIEAWPRSE